MRHQNMNSILYKSARLRIADQNRKRFELLRIYQFVQ